MIKKNTQLTKNFNLSEFTCNDGTPVPPEYYDNALALAQNLQIIRNSIKSPIFINSGYRTKSHNIKVGGSSRSFHLTCSAADIVAKNWKPYRLRRRIRKLIKCGAIHNGGLGSYRNFTHYDIRLIPARW